MQATILTLVYSGLIVAGSLLGGWLPSRWTISHMRMQLILSFVGGLMLGIALLHLLPEGIAEAGANVALSATLVGLLFMFFLIRTFHFHQHGPADSHDDAHVDCEHDHSHAHHHTHGGGPHELSWAGVATGLSVHTLIDGIALGAAVQADASHGTGAPIWGVGTFLAILFHKPLDAMSITSLMKASGWSNSARTAVNVGFSLMCPLGALLVVLGAQQLDTLQAKMLGTMLGFSAGVFLCISLGDLLPEVQFHRHDRLKLSASLLLGVAIAYGIGFIEPAHAHAAADKTTSKRGWLERARTNDSCSIATSKKPRANSTRGSINCASVSSSLTDDGESGNVFVGSSELGQLRFDIDFARDEVEFTRSRSRIGLDVGNTSYLG